MNAINMEYNYSHRRFLRTYRSSCIQSSNFKVHSSNRFVILHTVCDRNFNTQFAVMFGAARLSGLTIQMCSGGALKPVLEHTNDPFEAT